jgi:hypothetical protein
MVRSEREVTMDFRFSIDMSVGYLLQLVAKLLFI